MYESTEPQWDELLIRFTVLDSKMRSELQNGSIYYTGFHLEILLQKVSFMAK